MPHCLPEILSFPANGDEALRAGKSPVFFIQEPLLPATCPEAGKKQKEEGEAPTSICFLNRWLPESARWLIIMGKPEQGLQELHKVAKINGHKEATKSLTIEVRCYCW